MATAKTLQDRGPLLNMPNKEKKSSKQQSLAKNRGLNFQKNCEICSLKWKNHHPNPKERRHVEKIDGHRQNFTR